MAATSCGFQALEKWLTFIPVKKLLLISGWAHGTAAMQPLTDLLSERFDVQVLSGAKILAGKAIPEVDIVAGWSMGGMLAMERLPASCKKLILIASPARFCTDEGYACGTPEATARQISTLLRHRPATVLPGIAKQIYSPHALPDFPPADAPNIDVLAKNLDYLLRTDLRKTVPVIRIPVLILHGAEDALIPPEASEWLHNHLPDSLLKLFPGEGHAVALQNPKLVAKHINSFIT